MEFHLEQIAQDFAAQGMSIPLLQKDQLQAVGPPVPPEHDNKSSQTFVVMGPGTGLGVAGLLLRYGHWIVLETEGGHAGSANQHEVAHRVALEMTYLTRKLMD